MVAYSIVPADKRHLDELTRNMRSEDVAEVLALGMTPEQALDAGVLASRDAKAGLADGKVLAVFGIGTMPTHPYMSFIWLLSSREAEKHKMAFARWSKRFVDEERRRHRVLGNFVDARYTKAVEWVRWLGFTVYPATPLGPEGIPFHWFDMRTD